MTESEAVRITKQFANVEDDSRSQFRAKIDNAVKKTRLAKARRQWMLRNGAAVDFSAQKPTLSLDGFQSMANKRGEAIVEEIQAANPNVSLDEAQQMAVERVRDEFGL